MSEKIKFDLKKNWQVLVTCLLCIGILLVSSLIVLRSTRKTERPETVTGVLPAMHIPIMVTEPVTAKTSPQVNGVLEKNLKKYSDGFLTGYTLDGLAKVNMNGINYYVSPGSITYDLNDFDSLYSEQAKEKQKQLDKEKQRKKNLSEAQKNKEMEERERKLLQAEEEEGEIINISYLSDYEWNGSKLTIQSGVNYGPSGKETYYNLPMNGVVNIMRGIGNTDKYWIREDGVKMLGDFVMVAAHLELHPRGSYVATSLGMGIVCDTGTFALSNPTQIDIAVDW